MMFNEFWLVLDAYIMLKKHPKAETTVLGAFSSISKHSQVVSLLQLIAKLSEACHVQIWLLCKFEGLWTYGDA